MDCNNAHLNNYRKDPRDKLKLETHKQHIVSHYHVQKFGTQTYFATLSISHNNNNHTKYLILKTKYFPFYSRNVRKIHTN